MPTLTRLLLALIILIALIYGAMVTLVYLVKPVTTDITIDIAPENLHLRDRPAVSQPVDASQPANAQPSGTKLDGEQTNQQRVNQPKSSQTLPANATAPVPKRGDK